MLDSIRKIKHLPDLNWVLLEPKKAHRKKLLAKQWLIKKSYDKLFKAVYTLLKVPIEIPEIAKNKLVD